MRHGEERAETGRGEGWGWGSQALRGRQIDQPSEQKERE